MYLTTEECQVLLKSAPDGAEFVDEVVQLIRRANPRAFHSDDSLFSRTFFDQPVRQMPYRGFIRFAPPQQDA